MDNTSTPKVYAAIAGVMADLSKEGIAKSRSNQQQNYKFRGIDEVYNALSSILAKHGLLMLPRALSRETVERQTKSGGALFYVTVDMEFTLVCAEDASQHVIRTFGEAMDSADKATNKAMSAAYKYAAMQAFCIPTEGDNDADATTHEVARSQSVTRKDYGPSPLSGDFHGSEGQKGKSSYQAKKDGDDKRFNELRAEIIELESLAACGAWANARADEIKAMPEAWRKQLRGDLDDQRHLVATPEMEPAE
jgi:hypothetical protein